MTIPTFTQIVCVPLEENLELVISERSDGLYSAAQRRWTTIHGRRSGMWLKNAIIVNEEGLEEAANAFMAALDYVIAKRAQNAEEPDRTEEEAS